MGKLSKTTRIIAIIAAVVLILGILAILVFGQVEDEIVGHFLSALAGAATATIPRLCGKRLTDP